MKHIVWLSCVICLMSYLAGCARNSEATNEFYRGFYHGANQLQEVQALDDPPVVADTPLSYDAYQRERQAILSEDKDK